MSKNKYGHCVDRATDSPALPHLNPSLSQKLAACQIAAAQFFASLTY